jgi:hypothetical protein
VLFSDEVRRRHVGRAGGQVGVFGAHHAAAAG